MVLFPNCKINLGLNIIKKRSDGFHNIETIFYPLPLQDALEVIQNDAPAEKNIQYSTTGETIKGKTDDNLCVNAYHLLKKDFHQLPSIKLHLHKTIPAGAGLGGGSADGAFTLKLLNQKFDLGLSKERLIEYASQLGSDCPFFIINQPSFATGRGDFLESIELDLSAYKFIIVNPSIYVSTPEAFSRAIPTLPSRSIRQIIQQPVDSWKEDLKNDFEDDVFKKHPEIKRIKDEVYKAGAVYASMTGSGSTVYGLFKKDGIIKLLFPENYFVKELISKF